MAQTPKLSPYLGGPGARVAQTVLFAVHVALEIALLALAVAFIRVQGRLPIEDWHRALFLVVLGLSLVAFGWRGVVIGRDLLAAWCSRGRRGRATGPRDGPEGAP